MINTVNVVKAEGVYSPGYSLGALLAAIESVTIAGLQKNGNMWKSLGVIMLNIVPWEVPWPKTLGFFT